RATGPEAGAGRARGAVPAAWSPPPSREPVLAAPVSEVEPAPAVDEAWQQALNTPDDDTYRPPWV
ncbi:hypothetical protein, partial [Actinocorallia lasiicapitis]